MNIETGLISKILQEKDFIKIKDKQIKAYYFDKTHKPCFLWIEKFFMKNGCVPTVRVFKEKFPSISLETYEDVVGTEETLEYWCDKLRDKVTHNKIVDSFEEIAEALDNGEVEQATKVLKRTVVKIENDFVETSAINITDDAEDRKKRYEERKNSGGMIGIPTGIALLDYILKGFQDKQLITLMAQTSVGKANPLSTPVLTPNGFVPMRDIKVGSIVIGEDGNPYPVSAIYPQGVKDVYEITFHDGTKSRSCKEHLWKFKTYDNRRRNNDWRVEQLDALMKRPLRRGKQYNLCIPVNEPVHFEVSESLPLDPYVLGALLGDGDFTTDRITFSNPEQDILDKCSDILKGWGTFVFHQGTNCQWVFKSNDFKCNKLYRTIKQLNLQGCDSRIKFIPKKYLHASIEDRIKLLQGLFDTDGSVAKDGTYTFSTFSKQLQEDFMYLCRSLGYRCTSGLYNEEYRVRILTDDIIFSSQKHIRRFNDIPNRRNKYDYSVLKIVDIQKVECEECQCISVDSEDHTYLIDDFIVTHNTWLWVLIATKMWLEGYRVLFFTTEMSEEQIEDRLEAMAMGILYGNFSYPDYKSGKLDPKTEQQYFEFLDRKKGLETLVIETATDVSNVGAKMEQYDADIVFVDSAYLMDDEEGSDADWLRVTHVFRGLKRLAKRTGKPICANTQQDLGKSGGLSSLNFAKAIAHESDVVMELIRDEELKADREAKIGILKQREGTLGNVYVNWDFNRMNFDPIFSTDATGQTLNQETDNADDTDLKKNMISMED